MAEMSGHRDTATPAPARPVLGEDDVHVWTVDCEECADQVDELYRVLSADERERARRYRRAADQDRFVVARGMLRRVLSRYLASEPQEIRFGYGMYGKPELPDQAVRFNLSHSGVLALCAIARDRAVGVDVECERPILEIDQIARRYFSSEEYLTLARLPQSLRARAFLECWTRKEAYVKARGEGLLFPLNAFTVAVALGEPAALLENTIHPDDVYRWSFRSLDPAPGYVGALAVEGPAWRLSRFRLGHPGAGAI